jgi:acetyl-CoA carboxylase biotin carboxyl carrier protein
VGQAGVRGGDRSVIADGILSCRSASRNRPLVEFGELGTLQPVECAWTSADRPMFWVASSHDGPGGEGVPDIEAHIAGTVWKIECQIGDDVDEGDTVIILESMKMEMPVEAEDRGTVAEILCEEGQAVNQGDVLVRLS